MAVRSAAGCYTCKSRRKKCDETHPQCQRCIKSGIECSGYEYVELKGGHSQKRTRAAPRPASEVAQKNRASQSTAAPTSSLNTLASTTAASDTLNNPLPATNHEELVEPSTEDDLRQLPTSTPEGLLAAEREDPQISLVDLGLHPFPQLPLEVVDLVSREPLDDPTELNSIIAPYSPMRQKDVLDLSGDVSSASPGQPNSPRGPSSYELWPTSYWSALPDTDTGPDPDDEDFEEVEQAWCATPALDSSVPSNLLSFVLQSLAGLDANWARLIVFDPSRNVNHLKDAIVRQIASSESTRARITLISKVMKGLYESSTSNPEVLEMAASLARDMHQKLRSCKSQPSDSSSVDRQTAFSALDNTFEVLGIHVFSCPLSALLQLMESAAPVFRRACSEPPESLVNFGELLLQPGINLRHFAVLDAILAVGSGRPMFFRYEIDFSIELLESMKLRSKDFGLQWLLGVPDQVTFLVAWMNQLREDIVVGSGPLDKAVVARIEKCVENPNMFINGNDAGSPTIRIRRLIVQEGWRQALYVYLYMGLCGATPQDRRVIKAHNAFLRLVNGVKQGRHPDVYLLLPWVLVGMATTKQSDRVALLARLSVQPECDNPGTSVHDVLQILVDVWLRSTKEGRPVVWEDLRIACRRVTGMQKRCNQSRDWPPCQECNRAGVACEGHHAPSLSGSNFVGSRPGLTLARNTSRSQNPVLLAVFGRVQAQTDTNLEPTRDTSIGFSSGVAQPVLPIPPGPQSFSSIYGPEATLGFDEFDYPHHAPDMDRRDSSNPPSRPPYSSGPNERGSVIPFSKRPDKRSSRQAPPPSNKASIRGSLTPGQASLFDALLSLAPSKDDNMESSSFRVIPPTQALPAPSYSKLTGANALPPCNAHTLEDSEGVSYMVCAPLGLDHKVKSNWIPFVLQSYALWMTRFLFEPVRIVPLARQYVIDGYALGEECRWKKLMASHASRAATTSTAYNLGDSPEILILQDRMRHKWQLTNHVSQVDRKLDQIDALSSLDGLYDLISIIFKLTPLSNVLTIMQTAAPTFRRACPEPPERLIHLPGLLSRFLDISPQFYATLDILLGAITDRPMFFRYNVEFTPEVNEELFNLENGPGLRWLYGVPDRLVILLAKMNIALEDFGTNVRSELICELEEEIAGFKATIVASSDTNLMIGRLVVQECWRQATFVYLYMALCGASPQDIRVVRAHTKFMELLKGAKPGRNPDSFLIMPSVIIGIATSDLASQSLIRTRMLSLPDCSRPGTVGNDLLRILESVWSLGRPAVWSDLRLARLKIIGM